MKKASLIVDNAYKNNRIFDLNNEVLNRDNCLYPLWLLKERFYNHGINLSTQDINSINESEIVIYSDIPTILPNEEDIQKSYLFIFESEVIRPDNWNIKNHDRFNKIFTWNDDIVDNKKYFKFNITHKLIKTIDKKIERKEKLCTLIAGNKNSNHENELYSKRIEAIKWFKKKHPKDFEFYGAGWNKVNLSNRYLNYAIKKLGLGGILAPKYPQYMGAIESKNEVLSKYKFAICYENAQNIRGYVTEKIFDCFFAGCVPVYWGIKEINEVIPFNCFIDKRGYSTYEALYKYIDDMSDEKYLEYLTNIELYLNSEWSNAFNADFVVSKIVDIITEK